MATTYSKAKQVMRVPQGSTAAVATCRFHKKNGDARNLSTATGSLLFHCSTEDGTAVTTNGAAFFKTDGSDGLVSYSLTATELDTIRNLRCEFEVQGVDGGVENLIGDMFMLMVLERARG
jgi:hypothetical protein